MATNDFLQFCGTDTGTNLESQADYAIDSDRPVGNQPGVASSKFVNKTLRQSAAIASQVAQYVSNATGQNVLDDGNMTKLLAQITQAFKKITPTFQMLTSGTSTYNISYRFIVTSASATVGATYTNNGVTYTVMATLASGTDLWVTGSGDPTVSGTLTKATGTGDATITFTGFRKPIDLRVRMVGGAGGGGCGGSGSPTAGANGTNTTFGSNVAGLGAGGGIGGTQGGAGGSNTVSGALAVVNINGGSGSSSDAIVTGSTSSGGSGAPSPFGGAGGGTFYGRLGVNAATNSGSGGSGGGAQLGNGSGAGGGAGGYLEIQINSPSSTYSYVVGAGGAGGTGGTDGFGGGNGGSGVIVVEEIY